MPFKRQLFLVLTIFLLVSCVPGSATDSTVLIVFAAASLSEPFTRIGEQFEQEHPGVTVTFNFAGSQQLVQQILQGAPADLFASASQVYMDRAIEDGHAEQDSQRVFARNRLVVVYHRDKPLSTFDIQSLSQPGLRLVLADPAVPVGQYTLEFIDKAALDPAYGAGFRDGLLANVVSYEDNVKAVLAKVLLGEADAGIVYLSDVGVENAEDLAEISIPPEFNVTAAFPIAVLADSQSPDLAQSLMDYILSPTGQEILASYDFLPPED